MRWLLLTLLVLPVAAQIEPEPVAGPDVVMLVHHPFPDDADALGFAFGDDCSRACDAFVLRHGGKAPFADGIDFPGFIADGVEATEGLPGELDATVAEYERAVATRLGQDTPITITAFARLLEGEVRTSMWVETSQELGPGLQMWAALVEDPVHYEPPPALSNGVVEHPFTVRAIQSFGAVAPVPGVELRQDATWPLAKDWNAENMRLAVWIEQDRQALGTFQPGETVQAVSHALSAEMPTRQESRAVLVEAYSATWCAPCLIGDEALEEVAEAHGLPTGRSFKDAATTYLRLDAPPLLLALAAIVGFALFGFARVGRP